MLRAVPRHSVADADWNAFVEIHPTGWWWHRTEWINYSLAYTRGAVDLSFAVQDDDYLVGVVPLVRSEGRLVMGGQVTPHPLLGEPLRPLASFAEQYAESLGGPTLPIQMPPGIKLLGDPPSDLRVHVGYTHVVDLEPRQPDLWRDVRRSYKSIINKAQRTYAVGVYATPGAVEQARRLHVAVSGRETRPLRTWDLMGEWASHGNVVVAIASRDVANATDLDAVGPVAFALAIRYKKWAYYASAASRVTDVSHALQWELITTLRSDGQTRWYELGADAGAESTEKERGIAKFKAGFGGRRMPVLVVAPATSVH